MHRVWCHTEQGRSRAEWCMKDQHKACWPCRGKTKREHYHPQHCRKEFSVSWHMRGSIFKANMLVAAARPALVFPRARPRCSRLELSMWVWSTAADSIRSPNCVSCLFTADKVDFVMPSPTQLGGCRREINELQARDGAAVWSGLPAVSSHRHVSGGGHWLMKPEGRKALGGWCFIPAFFTHSSREKSRLWQGSMVNLCAWRRARVSYVQPGKCDND